MRELAPLLASHAHADVLWARHAMLPAERVTSPKNVCVVGGYTSLDMPAPHHERRQIISGHHLLLGDKFSDKIIHRRYFYAVF